MQVDGYFSFSLQVCADFLHNSLHSADVTIVSDSGWLHQGVGHCEHDLIPMPFAMGMKPSSSSLFFPSLAQNIFVTYGGMYIGGDYTFETYNFVGINIR